MKMMKICKLLPLLLLSCTTIKVTPKQASNLISCLDYDTAFKTYVVSEGFTPSDLIVFNHGLSFVRSAYRIDDNINTTYYIMQFFINTKDNNGLKKLKQSTKPTKTRCSHGNDIYHIRYFVNFEKKEV